MRSDVVVLFARYGSHYFDLAADVYDEARDARTYAGRLPVVAHPPCRGWGRLSTFAKCAPGEVDLARSAVATVRRVGGVLEHPSGSRLWKTLELGGSGRRDAFGGFTVPVEQSWWGHRAPKRTWLYVCGMEPCDIPAMPFDLGAAGGRVSHMGRSERERTPVDLAAWLIELASRCAR